MAWVIWKLGLLVGLVAIGAAEAQQQAEGACLLVELKEARLEDATGGSQPQRHHMASCKLAIESVMAGLLASAKAHGLAVHDAQALPAVFDGFDVYVDPRDAARFEALMRASGRVADVFPCGGAPHGSSSGYADATLQPLQEARHAADASGDAHNAQLRTERSSGSSSSASRRRRVSRRSLQEGASQEALPGTGVKMGLLTETGVDYTNPGLGGGFGANQKVAYGWDFWGPSLNFISPDANPMRDCAKNTTSPYAEVLLGNAAGWYRTQDNATGEWSTLLQGGAPGATVGVYKTYTDVYCWQAKQPGQDATYNDDAYGSQRMRAINAAWEDKMDILIHTDYFIGSSGDSYWYFKRAVALGMLVVAHTGYTPGSTFFTSDIANVAGVLTATPHTMDPNSNRAFKGEATFTAASASTAPLELLIPPGPGSHDPSDAFLEALQGLPLAITPGWAADPSIAADACTPAAFNSTDVKGKVVLVRRGGCGMPDKINFTLLAGAVAVITVSNLDAPWGPTWIDLLGRSNLTGATIMVPASIGNSVADQLRNGTSVSLTSVATKGYAYDGQFVWPSSPTGPAMDFSLSTHLVLGKSSSPQLTHMNYSNGITPSVAPGVINGVFEGPPVVTGKLAGEAAALLQALREKGDTPAAEDVRILLMNTATPLTRIYNDTPTYENPVHVGAGVPDWRKAAATPCVLDAANIVLPTGEQSTSVQFSVTNNGDDAVKYSLKHLAAQSYKMWGDGVRVLRTYIEQPLLGPGTPSLPVLLPPSFAAAELSFSVDGEAVDSIEVPPGDWITVDVAFKAPKELSAEPWLYGGYVQLAPSDVSLPTLSLPYHGLTTDIAKIPILHPQQPYEVNLGGLFRWYPATQAADGSLNVTAIPELVVINDGRTIDASWLNSTAVANMSGLDSNFFGKSSIGFRFLTIKPSTLVAWELLDNTTGEVLGDLNATALVRGAPSLVLPSGRPSTGPVLPLRYKDPYDWSWQPIPPGVYKARLTVQHIPGVSDTTAAEDMPIETITTVPFKVLGRDPAQAAGSGMR